MSGNGSQSQICGFQRLAAPCEECGEAGTIRGHYVVVNCVQIVGSGAEKVKADPH
jgi:hypothetical protein